MYLWAEKENANITNRNKSRNAKKTYKKECMANIDPWIYQRRSKHPLLTGHTRRESIV